MKKSILLYFTLTSLLLLSLSVFAQGNTHNYYGNPRINMYGDNIPAPLGQASAQGFELKYQDCSIVNGVAIEPTQQIEGYECRPTRNQDVIANDTTLADDGTIGNFLLQNLRKNLLGLQLPGELNTGRAAGEKCFRKILENNLIPGSYQMFDEDAEQVVANTAIAKSTATPRIPGFLAISEKIKFIALGCQSNICSPPQGSPQAGLEEYRCQPRYSYRCLEAGEQTPSDNKCCAGMIKNQNGLCEEVQLEEESILAGFPNHVDPETGLIMFSDDQDVKNLAQAKLVSATAIVRAFEFFFSQQNLNSRRGLHDNEIMKEIGVEFKARSLAALEKYNQDLNELEVIKNTFIQLTKQTSDPESYFDSQVGGVSYRSTQFTSAEQFRNFVQNANSGVEIFKFMAEEQKILLKYENSLYHALQKAIEGSVEKPNQSIRFILQAWYDQTSGRKGQTEFAGRTFTVWRKHWLWGKRRFKRRYHARYQLGSWYAPNVAIYLRQKRQASSWATNMFSYTPSTDEATAIKNSEAAKIRFHDINTDRWMIEPYFVGSMNYPDYGGKESGWFTGRKACKRIIPDTARIDKLYTDFENEYKKYLKDTYFSSNNTIFDISFGGIKECLTDNDFPIRDLEQCKRYKSSIDMVKNLAMESFISASVGSSLLNTHSIRLKSNFFWKQAMQLTHTMGIYEHMSAVPQELGGVAILNNPGINFKEYFDEYNNNPSKPGYLRFKSYLFYMAKAKSLEALIAENGIGSGGADNNYTPTTIYGSGNTVINTAGNNDQEGQQETASINNAISTSSASTNTAGIVSPSSNTSGNSKGSIGNAGASGTAYSKSLAKLNKSAVDFAKRNPKKKKKLKELAQAKRELLNQSSLAIAKQINSGGSSKGSIASLFTPENKKTKSKKETKKPFDSSQFIQRSQSANYNDSVDQKHYKESSSTNGKKQLTSLSDYQLKQAIKNSKDQAHLYKTSEYDGIFEKISKTYARNYGRFLVRKKRSSDEEIKKGGSLKAYENDKAKVMKMLDGF